MLERYYVKVRGSIGCRQPHFSLAEAYAEARRLFDLNGRVRRVYVLQAVGTIEPEQKDLDAYGMSLNPAVLQHISKLKDASPDR